MFTTTPGYLRLIAIFLLLAASAFAFQDPPDDGRPKYKTQDPLAQQLEEYPGLLNALAHLREKLSLEGQYPPLRSKSRLLPLVPASAVFYATFPNYGRSLPPPRHVFQQESGRRENRTPSSRKKAP